MTDLAVSSAPWQGLPERTLDRAELRALALRVAADGSAWRGQVAFPADHRHYVSLYRDTHVDVWLLCWTVRDDTGWHDHDVSSGAVAVVAGSVRESGLGLDGPARERVVPAGGSFSFGPEHIHRMSGTDLGPGAGSASIHVYSPPLWRMGQYAVGPNGALRRTPVSYADELRPVDPAPQV